jgi:hypothetical protein
MNLGVRFEHRHRLAACAMNGVMPDSMAALFFGLPRRHVTTTPALFLAVTPARWMPFTAAEMVIPVVVVSIVIPVMGKNWNPVVIAVMIAVMVTMFNAMIVAVLVAIGKGWRGYQA